MIFVAGAPLCTDDSSSCSQGYDILTDLMKHPVLVSASSSFSDVAERKFSVSKDYSSSVSRYNRWVYIFQREYATVDPALVNGPARGKEKLARVLWLKRLSEELCFCGEVQGSQLRLGL